VSTIIIDGVEHLVNNDTAAAIERLQRENAVLREASNNLLAESENIVCGKKPGPDLRRANHEVRAALAKAGAK
jgi:hypothetical protein